MSRSLSRTACTACAAAKRRCGKQMPHCARCHKQSIPCVYPPAKPSRFVAVPDEDEDHGMLSSTQQPESSLHLGGTLPTPSFSPRLDTNGVGSSWPSASPLALLEHPNHTLFDPSSLEPIWQPSSETWKTSLLVQKHEISPSALDHMLLQVKTVNQWLEDWIEKGSNPFIHPRLYQDILPSCIQDAHTALTSYIHRNESNKRMVFRIIENRSEKLLSEQPPITSLDSFSLLARVQSLLIYQVIGLFDGDIRLRHVSESHMPTLYSWGQKLSDASYHPILRGAEIFGSSPGEAGSGVYQVSDLTVSESSWLSYILSESMQRTWILASGVQGVYKIAQLTRPVDCSGASMIFTTRRGVWEAPSALAWEKLTSKVDVGLVRMEEVESLFEKYSADDVDEYTILVLSIMFGAEQIERWGG